MPCVFVDASARPCKPCKVNAESAAHPDNKDLELALVGRNLIARHRLEYISDFIPTAATEVAPSWAVTARWKF